MHNTDNHLTLGSHMWFVI